VIVRTVANYAPRIVVVRCAVNKSRYRLTKRGENVVGAVLALLAVLLAAVADRIAFMY
jgi:hypothetical protein